MKIGAELMVYREAGNGFRNSSPIFLFLIFDIFEYICEYGKFVLSENDTYSPIVSNASPNTWSSAIRCDRVA